MRIHHVAMFVNDLKASREFFIRYFGGVSNEMYHNPKTGLKTYILSFNGEAKLEIMYRPDVVPAEKVISQTGYAHLSFSVGSKQEVDKLTEVLRENGYRVASEPRTTGDGFYESCIADNEGNLIEITE